MQARLEQPQAPLNGGPRMMPSLAFSVHILTATGAALALLALLAAARGDWPTMFLWLGLALLVDAVDGPIARAIKVAERLPRWSGDVLDLVVDFTTYVFVPAFAIAGAGLMPQPWAIGGALLIAMTGTLYFADRRMKADDNSFRGFPAAWNVVAFYLLLLRPSAAIAGGLILAFAALTFVPVHFVHPLRVARLRSVNLALLALWGVLALLAAWQALAPDRWIVLGLCATGLYFLVAGLIPVRRSA